jgi:tetratricopeptide (TPR) repeat protein
VLADQERFDQAIEKYRKADELWQKERSQERKRGLYYWAELLRQQDQYEEAAKKCQAAIAIDPDYPEAHQGLGRARADQARFAEAIEQYRQADERWRKKESRKRKFALCGWADALLAQEQHEEAAKKCEEALSLDPECADACLQLGRVLAHQKRFADAVEQYRQADERWTKKESRKRKRALVNWADALREQEQHVEAAKKCEEALSLEPECAEARHQLGLVLADQERFADAIEQYRQADEKWRKKESKRRKYALCDWARAIGSQKDCDAAVLKFQEAIDVDPDAACFTGSIRVGSLLSALELLTLFETGHRWR